MVVLMTFWECADRHWFIFGALAFIAIAATESAVSKVLVLIHHLAASRGKK